MLNDPENVYKMPDPMLDRLARRYRALCRIEKTPGLLLRGGKALPFWQFLADQRAADIILQEYRHKGNILPMQI